MSAWIRTHRVSDGSLRYLVAYRTGGRATEERHAGTFKRRREALARRDFVLLEIASGRDPQDALSELSRPRTSMRGIAAAWLASRVDLGASTIRLYTTAVKSLMPHVEKLDPHRTSAEDVQALVNEFMKELKPDTIRLYVSVVFGQILDFAGVEPNPVRSRKVRFPRNQREPMVVPSGKEVREIIRCLRPRHRLFVRFLERTGLRISEGTDLEWRDVDEQGSRIRVRKAKTRAGVRWVVVPEPVMIEIIALVPREDRRPEGRVFPNLTADAVRKGMQRACRAAGIAEYHPHDLRHRYASMMGRLGVPRAILARHLGHSDISVLDVYEHVVFEIEDEELREWQEAAAQLVQRWAMPEMAELSA